MLEDGADILDIGAFSSRPGADIPSAKEEWERLSPAITLLGRAFPEARLSIDTVHSRTIENCLDTLGKKVIVNDISAGAMDSGMLPLAGRENLTYIAMHMKGTPATMNSLAEYDDVTLEVKSYFEKFALKAAENGIEDWILDPGFGFAKTTAQNYALIDGIPELLALGKPVLAGVSRKRMICEPLGITPEEAGKATQRVHRMLLEKGVSYLRVHDVAPTLATVKEFYCTR